MAPLPSPAVAGAPPGPLQFQELLAKLHTDGSMDSGNLLQENGTFLLAALAERNVPVDPSHGTPKFRAQDDDPQGQKEKEYANQIARILALSFQDASLLLRDYLSLTAAETNENSSRHGISSMAPIQDLRRLWKEQRRAMFDIIATISRSAADQDHPLHSEARDFMDKNGHLIDALVSVLENCIAKANSQETTDPTLRERISWDIIWVIETLFIALYEISASPAIITRLIHAIDSFKGTSSHSEPARAAFSNSSSLLITLTVIESFNLEMVTSSNDDIPAPDELCPIAKTRAEMDTMLKILDTAADCAEITVIRLAFATLGELRKQCVDDGFDCGAMARRAFQCDAVTVFVRMIGLHPPPHQFSIEWGDNRLKMVGAGFLSAFLCAYTPSDLQLEQLDLLAVLASNLIRGSADLGLTHLGQESDVQLRLRGINLLMRYSSAYFLQQSRPLLCLLSSLAGDPQTAQAVFVMLKSLGTAAIEIPETDQVSVHQYEPSVVSDDVILRETVNLFFGPQGPPHMLVVNEELSTSFGRLEAGTIGFCVSGLVFYQAQWNGWNHVAGIVSKLLSESSRVDLNVGLPDSLVTSGLASLDLLHRVGIHCTQETRQYLFGNLIPVRHLVDLVRNSVRLYDSSNRATKRASLSLLDFSSKCLCLAIAASGDDVAKFVLQRLNASVSGGPPCLTTAVRRAPKAFPLLTALLEITSECCEKKADRQILLMSFQCIVQEVIPAWLAAATEQLYSWRLAAVTFRALRRVLPQVSDEPLVHALSTTIAVATDEEVVGSVQYYPALKEALILSIALLTREDDTQFSTSIVPHFGKIEVIDSLASLSLEGVGFGEEAKSKRGSFISLSANRMLCLVFHKLGGLEGSSQVVWSPHRGFYHRFSSMISEHRKADLILLIRAAVVTGQRTISRSLLGPTEGKESNLVLRATVECLQFAIQNPSHEGSPRLARAATELLCVSWNQYGVLWFEQEWKDLAIWKLCGESLGRIPMDSAITETELEDICRKLLSRAEVADNDDSVWRPTDEGAQWTATTANLLQLVALSFSSLGQEGAEEGPALKPFLEFCTSSRFDTMTDKLRDVVASDENWLLSKFERAEDVASGKTGLRLSSPVNRDFGANYVVDLETMVKGDLVVSAEEVEILAALNIVYSRVHVVVELASSLSNSLQILLIRRKSDSQEPGLPSNVVAKLIQITSGIVCAPWRAEKKMNIAVVSGMASLLMTLSSAITTEELAAHNVGSWIQSLSNSIEWLSTPDLRPQREVDLALCSMLLSATEILCRAAGSLKDENRLIASVLQCLDTKADRTAVAASAGTCLCRFASRNDSFRWPNPATASEVLARSLEALSHSQDDLRSAERSQSAKAIILRLMLVTTNDASQLVHSIKDTLRRLALAHLKYDGTAYSRSTRERSAAYEVWVAQLALAANLIKHSCGEADEELAIAEYAAGVTDQILSFSLHLLGDWPRLSLFSGSSGPEEPHPSLHITLARLEEAEVATLLLWTLAEHSDTIAKHLPDLVGQMVYSLGLYVSHAYRLMRAEPIDRWVLPVSRTEINRAIEMGSGPTASLGRSPAGSAVRTVLGRYTGPAVPPSPKMPITPASPSLVPRFTPSSSTPGTGGTPSSGTSRGGLAPFSEDATRSLLDGINNALAALRRIHFALERPVFEPSMILSSDRPSIGLLVAMLLHACNEIIHRGTDSNKRNALFLLFDNAMCLVIGHVKDLMSKGSLGVGPRDELRKRLATVIDKLRRSVPPPPSGCIALASEIEDFLGSIRG